MMGLGKLMIMVGGVILLIGIVVLLAGKAHFPLGRLPGDITYRGKHTTVYFPLATSLLLSIVLSFIFWLINRK